MRQIDGRWQVGAVLDWEFARVDTPLFDIGGMLRYDQQLDPAFEPAFVDDFQTTGGVLPPDWKALARLCDLLNLCDFLANPGQRETFVPEVVGLIRATVEHDTKSR
jgi:hypothetical protein